MPTAHRAFFNGEIYHLYNRGVNGQPIFRGKQSYLRAMSAMDFYRFSWSGPGLASFLRSDQLIQAQVRNAQQDRGMLVEIYAYCLMPNHYHVLIKQVVEGGISNYISRFQNSYTRFYNIRSNRSGPLFTGPFKSVKIEDQIQLLHTSRYIHLNPYSAGLVDDIEGLRNYPWSSLQEYGGNGVFRLADTTVISESFVNSDSYMRYIADRADFQR